MPNGPLIAVAALAETISMGPPPEVLTQALPWLSAADLLG
jgi:uncharacterized protein (DUF433 family)